MKRTHTCGELRGKNEGETVTVNGWVHRRRDHGGITFISLRDRYGLTQITFDAETPEAVRSLAGELKMEYCIAVSGTVRKRPASMANPDMPTGEIEISAQQLQILSKSDTLPFMIDEFQKDGSPLLPGEDLRLTYRYLDLRSQAMQSRIALRHRVASAVRRYLDEKGFYEIETPTFVKSTPEGARDYLVPSRLYPGEFYALPQSPQLYKQLLMCAGFDRYFQIARCYRDEDARGDRQPEFTQIDIEMSFVSREDVLSLTEGLMQRVFLDALGMTLSLPFTRLSYEEAMELYGSDKPDLRFDLKMQDARQLADLGSFEAFKNAVAHGGTVKALVVPQAAAQYSRKKIEELEERAKVYRAKGLAWMKLTEAGFEGGIAKFFSGSEEAVKEALSASAGDLLLFVADENRKTACTALGAVRSKLGRDLDLCKKDDFAFVWIVDFPLFEWNEEENRWEAAHHMFSMPQEKYLSTLESDPASVKGDLYDLVLNGYELASGSIRIHDPELQKRIFAIVGFDEAEGEKKFGFLTKAFRFGPPPHGGIAPGLDRLVMLMCAESSIKEVIAFPKNTFAQSPMDNCPSPVDQRQLDELHLTVHKS